ncbi:pyroglutamyl-peptidase I [uncultured Bifidobacterium sp.]|uniref:pyroglutamyl-peptidase I n=1 Tax=uncultured Bifidobacterium sp. TaxID=165187 RepID=UPI00338F222D
MHKVLVTGFDPFGGEAVNPAYEAVKLLPDTIAGAHVVKLEVPTVFTRSAQALEQAMAAERPDAVICVGQAGGRSCVTVEKVAVNLVEARIPDNDGAQPLGEPLRADGPDAYFATVPVKAMVANIRANHLPAFISYTAGTYVCNSIMYHALYLCDRTFHGTIAGFMHVPYEPGQVVDKPEGTPSMPLDTIARSLEYAIEAVVRGDVADDMVAGATH